MGAHDPRGEDVEYRVDVYIDNVGEYRWHAVSPSGHILADSGEGYRDLPDCLRMADVFAHGRPIRLGPVHTLPDTVPGEIDDSGYWCRPEPLYPPAEPASSPDPHGA